MRQNERHDSSQSIGLMIMDSNVEIDVRYSPWAGGDIEMARDVKCKISVETNFSPGPYQASLEPDQRLTGHTTVPSENILNR